MVSGVLPLVGKKLMCVSAAIISVPRLIAYTRTLPCDSQTLNVCVSRASLFLLHTTVYSEKANVAEAISASVYS